MALENARIDQLPEGTPALGDFLVFRDMVNGVTKRTLVDQFIPSDTTADYEWLPDNDPGYQTDEVVTYAGKWWQSLIDDNLNIVPGTDPTSWVEISKSTNLGFWTAGLYTEDEVAVLKTIAGITYMFVLDAAKPYVSADFDAELAAGDWVGVEPYTSNKKWNFAANANAFPTSIREGQIFVAEDAHGADGDADFVAEGTWMFAKQVGANAFNQFYYK